MLSMALAIVFMFGVFGCGKKTWSEQDIASMFSDIAEEEWEYVDGIQMPDHASGRIGSVLFRDNTQGTSNVAFFDSQGYSQQCGTDAELAVEPDFTYLGNGAVTFKLKTEDGVTYNYTLTISVDGENVYFKAEDDLAR